jgi:hypothetical protein
MYFASRHPYLVYLVRLFRPDQVTDRRQLRPDLARDATCQRQETREF